VFVVDVSLVERLDMKHKRIRQLEIVRCMNPPKICTKENCDKKHQAKGLCGYHYQIMMRVKYRDLLLTSYGFTIDYYRLALLNMLGPECVKCGFRDLRALQLDHIHGGGCKERKTINHQKLIRYYHDHPKIAFQTLQVLCANCNWIKLCEERHRSVEI